MIFTQILIRMQRVNVTVFQGAMVLALLAIFLLPGCTNPAGEQPAPETGVAEVTLEAERFAIPEDAGMAHFVEAVDENLFIGIAVSPQAAQNEEPQTVAVYLCDGETVSQWIVEEISGQEAVLTAGETRVDVTIADESVSGTVALSNAEPQPFTARPATGDAGLYRAEWTLAGIDYQMDWIVLADGRQRGGLDGKGNDVYPPPRIVN